MKPAEYVGQSHALVEEAGELVEASEQGAAELKPAQVLAKASVSWSSLTERGQSEASEPHAHTC